MHKLFNTSLFIVLFSSNISWTMDGQPVPPDHSLMQIPQPSRDNAQLRGERDRPDDVPLVRYSQAIRPFMVAEFTRQFHTKFNREMAQEEIAYTLDVIERADRVEYHIRDGDRLKKIIEVPISLDGNTDPNFIKARIARLRLIDTPKPPTKFEIIIEGVDHRTQYNIFHLLAGTLRYHLGIDRLINYIKNREVDSLYGFSSIIHKIQQQQSRQEVISDEFTDLTNQKEKIAAGPEEETDTAKREEALQKYKQYVEQQTAKAHQSMFALSIY